MGPDTKMARLLLVQILFVDHIYFKKTDKSHGSVLYFAFIASLDFKEVASSNPPHIFIPFLVVCNRS